MNTTFNVAFDKDLLKEVDVAVKEDMSSRSEYLRRLVRQDIQARKKRMAKDAWDALELVVTETEELAKSAGYRTPADFTELAAKIRQER